MEEKVKLFPGFASLTDFQSAQGQGKELSSLEYTELFEAWSELKGVKSLP